MAMTSFFSRSKLLSHLYPQQGSTGANPSPSLHSRALHMDPGVREKARNTKADVPGYETFGYDLAMFCDAASLVAAVKLQRYGLKGFVWLLEEDPALKRFKSHKRNVWRLKRLGDALTIVVVAGCCWEIYVRAELKKKAAR